MNSLKKSENTISSSPKEEKFFNEIREMLRNARLQTYTAINSIMTQTYWKIGKRIVEQEQEGNQKTIYCSIRRVWTRAFYGKLMEFSSILPCVSRRVNSLHSV